MPDPKIIAEISISETMSYRTFVDPDIAAMFEGNKTYFSWEPLVAQLVKELRDLRMVRAAEFTKQVERERRGDSQ